MNIINSTFTDLIGLSKVSLLLNKYNKKGMINISGTTIENTMSNDGIIDCNVGSLNVIDSVFKGNYAKRLTNGINMIDSQVKLHGSTVDNSMNKHKFQT